MTSLSKNNPHEGVFRGSPNSGILFDSCLAKQDKEIDMRCCLNEASSSNDSENRTSGPGASARLCRLPPEGRKNFLKGKSISSPIESIERNNTVGRIPVSPCLLFIQHAGTDDYDPTLILGKTPITDVTEIKDEFMHHLNNLISEIFDPDTPFNPTEERTRCKSCPFHALCQS